MEGLAGLAQAAGRHMGGRGNPAQAHLQHGHKLPALAHGPAAAARHQQAAGLHKLRQRGRAGARGGAVNLMAGLRHC